MSQINQVQIDFDKEIGRVDKAIAALGEELEELVYKRYELIAKKLDLDTDVLIECILESELMPKEVTDLIVSAMEKKHVIGNRG